MFRHQTGLGVCALALAATLGFAQAPGSIDAEGNLYWPNGRGRSPLKRKGVWKADAVALAPVTATLDALAAIMKATAEANSLEGYWVKEHRRIEQGGTPVRFETSIYPFPLEDLLKGGQYVAYWGQETESIAYRFNQLPGAMGRRIVVQDTNGEEIYARPRVTGTFRGFPIIEGQDLVIARAGRDPWAAVSYARALKLALPLLEKDRATAEARLAGLRKKNEETQAPAYEERLRAQLEKQYGALKTTQPERWKTRLAAMERELQYNREQAAQQANPQRGQKDGAWYWNPIDAHAEAQRRMAAANNAPACIQELPRDAAEGRYALPGNIEPAPAPNCEPLVTANAAYFDASLPRTAAQILVVRSIGRCAKVQNGTLIPNARPKPGKVSHGCERHPIYWEQMDWSKVAALLRP